MNEQQPSFDDVLFQASELVEGIKTGNARSLAKSLTAVENGTPVGTVVLDLLYPYTGNAHTIGITGPAGAGKSTLVTSLTKEFRIRDKTVGIIAVDPSSPITTGALLGDRVRMQDLLFDSGVTMRSVASRGSFGGISETTQDMMSVMDAYGRDIILVETVGSGQDDTEISHIVDTNVVVNIPGAGDDIQAMKAGILETADIFVVNKADLPGADGVVKQLQTVRKIPIISTIAMNDKDPGVASLATVLENLWSSLVDSDNLAKRRHEQIKYRVLTGVKRELMSRAEALGDDELFQTLTESIFAKTMTPGRAVELLVDK